MSILIITGGSLTYGRTVKTGDYENKKLDLTLNFNVPEGEELSIGQTNTFADQAIDFVHDKLGLPVAKRPAAAQAPVTSDHSGSPSSAPAKPASRSRRPPPVDVELTAEDKAKIAGTANISTAPEDRVDPEAVVDETAAAHVEGTEPDPAAVDDDILTASAPPITDAALVDAVTKHNAKIKNPVAIRALIGKFVGAGKQVKDLPPELRQKFLDELHAL